jgi:hypothetical protein
MRAARELEALLINHLETVSIALVKKLLHASRFFLAQNPESTYFHLCPNSHVPVAVCRSVGIRTRGRTAARSEIAKTACRTTRQIELSS